jgi:hypothetical protein
VWYTDNTVRETTMTMVRTTVTVRGNGTHDELVEAVHAQLQAMCEHDVPVGYVGNNDRLPVKLVEYDPAPDGQENLRDDGTEDCDDEERLGPGFRYRDYPGQGEG